ncbi:MAG: YdeI/OmpD-associated family protein [Flavitalea sp.]
MSVINFETTILQFDKHGDKTNWTYILIPANHAQKMNPGKKTTYRVKGTIDKMPIEKLALIPGGEGNFILPVNAGMRKELKKATGAKVKVSIDVDDVPPAINESFIACLKDEPEAFKNFSALAKSHQLYFSNWINSAKTQSTHDTRIAHSVSALLKKMDYGQMIRSLKKDK